jgi:hypothetical protein
MSSAQKNRLDTILTPMNDKVITYLSRLGYEYDFYALRRFEEIKRYSILVVFLTV